MSTKTKSTQRAADAVQTSFSLKRATLKKLKAAAAADNRSVSNFVNLMAEAYLSSLEVEKRESRKND